MTSRGHRLSKLEHRQRELDLQCPRCGIVASMVPLEDGGTELRRYPEGEAVELALTVAELAYIGYLRGQQIVIGDELFAEGGRQPAPGWEVPTGASWMPKSLLDWLASQADPTDIGAGTGPGA
jgi:hypothetical protein